MPKINKFDVAQLYNNPVRQNPVVRPLKGCSMTTVMDETLLDGCWLLYGTLQFQIPNIRRHFTPYVPASS